MGNSVITEDVFDTCKQLLPRIVEDVEVTNTARFYEGLEGTIEFHNTLPTLYWELLDLKPVLDSCNLYVRTVFGRQWFRAEVPCYNTNDAKNLINMFLIGLLSLRWVGPNKDLWGGRGLPSINFVKLVDWKVVTELGLMS